VIGGGSSREVAHRDLAFVAGRQDEVLAAFAGVRSGKAHVHDVPLVQVGDDAHKRAWGQFNDHRAVRQIDVGPFVWRVGVWSEDELFWTAFEDKELIISRETCGGVTLPRRRNGNGGIEELVGRDGGVEVGIVVSLGCGVT
jgi:hypothetical protein